MANEVRSRDVQVAEVGRVGLVPIQIAFIGAAARGGDDGREEVRGLWQRAAAEDEVVGQRAVEPDLIVPVSQPIRIVADEEQKGGRATNVPGQRQRLDVDQQQQHGQQLGGGPQSRHDSGGDSSGGGCCGGEDGVEADHSGERVTHANWPVTGSLMLNGLSENARPGQQNEGEKKEGMEANGDSMIFFRDGLLAQHPKKEC